MKIKMIGKYKVYPLAAMIPEMDERSFAVLKKDIEKNYQNERIAMHDGFIVDGRARMRACLELGREPQVYDIGKVNPMEYILSYNACRRQMTPVQLGMMRAKAKEILSDEEFFHPLNMMFLNVIDRAFSISEEDERIANTLMHLGCKELIAIVDANRVTARDAMDIVLSLEKSQQLDAFEPGGCLVDEHQKKRIGLRDRTKFLRNVVNRLNDEEAAMMQQWLSDRKKAD